jgi:hypothetical protein
MVGGPQHFLFESMMFVIGPLAEHELVVEIAVCPRISEIGNPGDMGKMRFET